MPCTIYFNAYTHRLTHRRLYTYRLMLKFGMA